MSGYFNNDELILLQSLEYRSIQDVNYHIWVNKAKPAEAFEVLDYIEITFEDNEALYLTAGMENAGIRFLRGGVEELKAQALIEVGNVVSYRVENKAETEPWSEAISKPIVGVELSSDDKTHYLNSAIQLDFGDYKLEIHLAEEGLEVEFIEEID